MSSITENLTTLSQVSERARALVVTKDTFQRFVDYTTEEDRIAAQQEKKAAKIAALKKATYEKSKTWDSTIEVCLIYSRFKIIAIKYKEYITFLMHRDKSIF